MVQNACANFSNQSVQEEMWKSAKLCDFAEFQNMNLIIGISFKINATITGISGEVGLQKKKYQSISKQELDLPVLTSNFEDTECLEQNLLRQLY